MAKLFAAVVAALSLALATAGAALALAAGGSLGPTYTVSLSTGEASIPGTITCTADAESAYAVITLSQRHPRESSQTTSITTACPGTEDSSVPFVATFAGFRPGRATLQACYFASNGAEIVSACSLEFAITLVPAR